MNEIYFVRTRKVIVIKSNHLRRALHKCRLEFDVYVKHKRLNLRKRNILYEVDSKRFSTEDFNSATGRHISMLYQL